MGQLALAIHDLSCYSKSSLTVVLPVLEALGVECAVLPTAIISTQTDGYDSIFFQDETRAMERIFEKHLELGICYDGIYSGFLGSVEQIDIVEKILDSYDNYNDSVKPLKLVDPVLGDNGKLYQTISQEQVESMKRLVSKADIITPNYTEVLLLSNQELSNGLSMKDIEALVDRARKLGSRLGVITSIPLAIGTKANVAYDENGYRLFQFDELGVSYPGSGDLFASLLFSLYITGTPFFSSALLSTELSSEAVLYSYRNNRERRRGVELYPVFKELKRRVL